MAVASGGASGARPPHLNSVPSYFMFGPPNYHEGAELLCAVVDSQSAIAYWMTLVCDIAFVFQVNKISKFYC